MRLVKSAEQSTEEVGRSAHDSRHFVRHFGHNYAAGVYTHLIFIEQLYLRAHRSEYLHAEGNIADLGAVI